MYIWRRKNNTRHCLWNIFSSLEASPTKVRGVPLGNHPDIYLSDLFHFFFSTHFNFIILFIFFFSFMWLLAVSSFIFCFFSSTCYCCCQTSKNTDVEGLVIRGVSYRYTCIDLFLIEKKNEKKFFFIVFFGIFSNTSFCIPTPAVFFFPITFSISSALK